MLQQFALIIVLKATRQLQVSPGLHKYNSSVHFSIYQTTMEQQHCYCIKLKDVTNLGLCDKHLLLLLVTQAKYSF